MDELSRLEKDMIDEFGGKNKAKIRFYLKEFARLVIRKHIQKSETKTVLISKSAACGPTCSLPFCDCGTGLVATHCCKSCSKGICNACDSTQINLCEDCYRKAGL